MIGTPEEAVERFIHLQTPKAQFQIAKDQRAEDGGGSFVVAHFPQNKLQVYFASYDHSRWNVWNICGVTESEDVLVNSGNSFDENGKMANWGWGFVWTKARTDVADLVGDVRLDSSSMTKPVPISFTKIGNLPIWVHKFTQNVGGIDALKGYDKQGAEVWHYPR